MATDDQLRGIRAKLELKLSTLNVRLATETDSLDFTDVATGAIVDALVNIPGALDVASRMVSGTLFQGLGDTFDKHTDELDTQVGGGGGSGWEYTAVMDGATCDVCATWDGTTFDTWEEIAGPSGPLPDGGPNEDCLGTDRCRCRASIA